MDINGMQDEVRSLRVAFAEAMRIIASDVDSRMKPSRTKARYSIHKVWILHSVVTYMQTACC